PGSSNKRIRSWLRTIYPYSLCMASNTPAWEGAEGTSALKDQHGMSGTTDFLLSMLPSSIAMM
ncbi:hypothetical protein, partial [Candidatus Accumulibacter aalborgensis]|uniref:hypothetical protein n=1 Tax=Candidatus Accumulibacter aalborgensis TaxID=1860102 RepID=UPI001C9244E9